ncbi:MAG: hypothetical protein EP322_09055 [Bacteroidetes bacterium]|nr:MAG: hypothetical protein EP322_09055 [Bacteroidota bacterium]
MRWLLFIVFIAQLSVFAQKSKERIPSYFGIQISPVFPTRFVGEPRLDLSGNGFETSINQQIGYHFSATVRAGVTKLIAFDTGIGYTERNFSLTMAYPDSSSYGENKLSFIEYDIPLNGLVYIQLTERWFMNTSLGIIMNYKPSDVQVYTKPGGLHTYHHLGLAGNRLNFDFNANVGFEFRTEKSGFFYLGGSARVPFAPVFTLLATYTYQGIDIPLIGEVDGSFLSIDFKYFFPNIKNKGPQFNKGPIE